MSLFPGFPFVETKLSSRLGRAARVQHTLNFATAAVLGRGRAGGSVKALV
jgi:hypothetical protein